MKLRLHQVSILKRKQRKKKERFSLKKERNHICVTEDKKD